MEEKNKKIIITYFTSVEALATEKACNDKGLGGRIITTPRNLTADCGMAYSITVKNIAEFVAFLKSENIKYDKIVELNVP